jgi:hypothetical protein
MRAGRLRASAALLLALAALGPAACGDDDGGGEDGSAATTPRAETTAGETGELPPEFKGPALEDQDRSAEATTRVQTAELEAPDGTTASVRIEDGGPPQNWTGSGQCDGATFDQAATVDDPASGALEIAGVGTAELTISRTVTVIAGAPPPPCEERIGSWTGADGDLADRSGSFTIVTTQGASLAESTLTLREE